MELIEGIETRKSIRAFKPTPVLKRTLNKILEVASRSPSYTNTQPWEVAVISGKKKDELSGILYKLAGTGVPSSADIPAPKEWPADLDKRAKDHGARMFAAIGLERADDKGRKEFRLMNFMFYGAPTILFLFIDRSLTAWSIFDSGLFAQNICLAAHSFGLGTCLQASPAGYPDAVRSFLGIPNSKMLVIAIAIGYPDDSSKYNSYTSLRASPDDFVKWYE